MRCLGATVLANAPGGSVASMARPACAHGVVVPFARRNCSMSTAPDAVDAGTGAYLGRQGGVIADAVCPREFLGVTLWAWVLVLAVAGVAAGVGAWRMRGRERRPL